ncbi:hypothetical protein [Glycocaulis sp.]
MIDAHNQAASGPPVWLERVLFASGAVIFAVMGILRFGVEYVPGYPLSLVWLAGAALMGAGIALAYRRLTGHDKAREDDITP